MKILWHSNAPWAQTGYGQQTALFTTRIRDAGHDVAISSVWGLGGSGLDWEGIRVYPQDDRWGKALLAAYSQHFGGGEPVQILTLMDVFVLTGADHFAEHRVAAWCPVDHDPLPPRVYEFFGRTGARPIAMSQFGKRMLEEAGLPSLYVPHGVDTSIFWRKTNREAIRKGMNLPADAYVIGMVANNKGTNPPRKSFPQVFQAFAELRKKRDDVFLYIHSEMTGRDHGMNLAALADVCGIQPSWLSFSDQVMMEVGVPPDDMSYLYSGFDVLANPSYGEGFGIPIIEAQACGTPVIVTNWTSMPELVGAGWVVEGDPYYDAGHGSFYKAPSVAEVYQAMSEAYDAGHDYGVEQATAHAQTYDADRVFSEFWTPVLAELENPHREVGPIDGARPRTSVALAPLSQDAVV